MNKRPVQTGLDVLLGAHCQSLKGFKVGVLAHPSSISSQFVHVVDGLRDCGVELIRLFGPEHGIYGDAQYMEAVSEGIDTHTGLPVVSLYGNSYDSLKLPVEALRGIDCLVIDLQDVGSRYYTFAYTMAFAMQSCAQAGVKCLVLDRPNPIGCLQVEGNTVSPPYRSFVGEYALANRHGLTLGELAHLFKQIDGHACDVEVVQMQDFERSMYYDDTGLPWVLPSPNMPTPQTALVYPGGCLLEGTNLSEGRGTTRPFELLGAPYIQDPYAFAEAMMSQNLPGIALRPCYFTPTFDKHKGQLCAGVQVHVLDRQSFLPLRTYVAAIWAARKWQGFAWRTAPYEFVNDRLAIDLLLGSEKPRLMLEAGGQTQDVIATFKEEKQTFEKLRKQVLLY